MDDAPEMTSKEIEEAYMTVKRSLDQERKEGRDATIGLIVLAPIIAAYFGFALGVFAGVLVRVYHWIAG